MSADLPSALVVRATLEDARRRLALSWANGLDREEVQAIERVIGESKRLLRRLGERP